MRQQYEVMPRWSRPVLVMDSEDVRFGFIGLRESQKVRPIYGRAQWDKPPIRAAIAQP